MVNLLAFASTALFAATMGGAHAADEPASCAPVSFVDQSAVFTSLNSYIDLAKSAGLLKPTIAAFDPLVLTNKRLEPISVSLLGAGFMFTPIIKQLTAAGVSNVVLHHLNVTGPSGIDIAADFPGTFAANGTVTFEVAQTNHQLLQICWTNLLQPLDCPPLTFDFDFNITLQDVALIANVDLEMVTCSPTAPAGTCKDLAVTDLLTAVLTKNLTTFLTRFFTRVKSLSLTTLQLTFDEITYLNFYLDRSGPLLTEISKVLLNFTAEVLNMKGAVYDVALAVVDKLAKSLINQFIKENLGPMFKGSCVDA